METFCFLSMLGFIGVAVFQIFKGFGNSSHSKNGCNMTKEELDKMAYELNEEAKERYRQWRELIGWSEEEKSVWEYQWENEKK